MPEPILHVAVPFASLAVLRTDVGWRKILFASLVALTPDLDLIFNAHRSQSHSLVLLAVVALPLLILTRNRKALRTLVLLGAFGVLTHLILDTFQLTVDSYSTPLLWPFFSQLQWLSTGLSTGQIGESFDAPILTIPGLVISFMLMAPSVAMILRDRTASRKETTRQPSPSEPDGSCKSTQNRIVD